MSLPPATTPIPMSYWVLPGRFLAGEYPRTPEQTSSVKKLTDLLEAPITRFVDLTTQEDGLEPYAPLLARLGGGRVQHHRFPIADVSIPAARAEMAAILDHIDGALCAGEHVYVHCWGGVGRTGTVVGCWLARHLGREAGLQRLQELWRKHPKSARRRSPETPEQWEYVKTWREDPPLEDPCAAMIRGMLHGD